MHRNGANIQAIPVYTSMHMPCVCEKSCDIQGRLFQFENAFFK